MALRPATAYGPSRFIDLARAVVDSVIVLRQLGKLRPRGHITGCRRRAWAADTARLECEYVERSLADEAERTDRAAACQCRKTAATTPTMIRSRALRKRHIANAKGRALLLETVERPDGAKARQRRRPRTGNNGGLGHMPS